MTDHSMIQSASEPCGVLIVDKPAGMTSHDVVGRVRRLYGTRRVGHTGTLDPMATGVLVVLIGRAAKAAEYLGCDRKHYRAVLRLGLTTDTEDITGQILSRWEGSLPDFAALEAVLGTFRGDIRQVPPMYSALKVNGQKLYDLARKGQTIARESRPITIYRLTAKPLGNPAEYELDVVCSAGTYIRTLCADIGAALGCGGVMAALRRVQAGPFSLAQAKTPDELEALSPKERLACLAAPESLFSDLPDVRLPAFYERLCRNGCAVAQHKLNLAFPVGTRVCMRDAGGSFFALGEIITDADGHDALKAIKIFSL